MSPDDRELVGSLLWDAGTTGLAEVEGGLVAGFDDRDQAERVASLVAGWPASVAAVRSTDWQGTDESTEVVVAAPGRAPTTLSISAGPTFGHGGHPTTALAIDLLSGLAGPGCRVLDVGTGSGVLAIAAAVLGAGPVVGIDIDPTAVQVAQANAAANGVDIVTSSAGVEATPELIGGDRFDLVVINVLAPVHRELAPAIARVLAADGSLITSGYLEPDADTVVACHTEAAERVTGAGLTVTRRRISEGWMANRLDRSPGGRGDQGWSDEADSVVGG